MENKQQLGLDKAVLIIGLVIYGTGFSLLYVIFAPLSREIGLSINQFGILIAISNVALVFSSYYWGKINALHAALGHKNNLWNLNRRHSTRCCGLHVR